MNVNVAYVAEDKQLNEYKDQLYLMTVLSGNPLGEGTMQVIKSENNKWRMIKCKEWLNSNWKEVLKQAVFNFFANFISIGNMVFDWKNTILCAVEFWIFKWWKFNGIFEISYTNWIGSHNIYLQQNIFIWLFQFSPLCHLEVPFMMI